MNTEKAIKKIEKYLGVKVERQGHKCTFLYENKTCRFHDSSGDAHSFHIRRTDDHSDLQSDYFAGYHLKNLTQFLHSLKQPDPKFPNGSLIKGRINKRAARHGIAGVAGVVIDVGLYGAYNILWNGSEQISTYPYERDLEGAE
jgi:hypothetical protein|tara:strand:- start:1772 stop:2200 length:429 start_codon:yes stop_codon:yes gene_type:complete